MAARRSTALILLAACGGESDELVALCERARDAECTRACDWRPQTYDECVELWREANGRCDRITERDMCPDLATRYDAAADRRCVAQLEMATCEDIEGAIATLSDGSLDPWGVLAPACSDICE